jgi:hypothetical protein
MTVEDGLIRAHGGMGLLYWSVGKVGNCVIRVVYKMRDFNDNSGVLIRIPIEPREEWMPVHYGYEVQIDNHPETSGEDEYHVTGTLPWFFNRHSASLHSLDYPIFSCPEVTSCDSGFPS